jgi:hypothetical protein
VPARNLANSIACFQAIAESAQWLRNSSRTTVYIAFAVLLGVLLAALSLYHLREGIQAAIEFAQCNATVEPSPIPGGEIVTNCYGIDGPDPLSFESYGKLPVFAAMFFLTAFGALKRRWEIAQLPWLFLIPFVMGPAIAGVLYDVGRSELGFSTIAWLAIPIAGIVVASRLPLNSRTSPAEVALAAIATVSYVWRAIAIPTGPHLVQAMNTLGGGDAFYLESVDLLSGSIVGLGAAIALFVGAVASLYRKRRVLTAAFAFTTGLSLPGFLKTLDLTLGLRDEWNAVYVIQEAVAFVACVAALALTRGPERAQAAPT